MMYCCKTLRRGAAFAAVTVLAVGDWFVPAEGVRLLAWGVHPRGGWSHYLPDWTPTPSPPRRKAPPSQLFWDDPQWNNYEMRYKEGRPVVWRRENGKPIGKLVDQVFRRNNLWNVKKRNGEEVVMAEEDMMPRRSLGCIAALQKGYRALRGQKKEPLRVNVHLIFPEGTKWIPDGTKRGGSPTAHKRRFFNTETTIAEVRAYVSEERGAGSYMIFMKGHSGKLDVEETLGSALKQRVRNVEETLELPKLHVPPEENFTQHLLKLFVFQAEPRDVFMDFHANDAWNLQKALTSRDPELRRMGVQYEEDHRAAAENQFFYKATNGFEQIERREEAHRTPAEKARRLKFVKTMFRTGHFIKFLAEAPFPQATPNEDAEVVAESKKLNDADSKAWLQLRQLFDKDVTVSRKSREKSFAKYSFEKTREAVIEEVASLIKKADKKGFTEDQLQAVTSYLQVQQNILESGAWFWTVETVKKKKNILDNKQA